VLTATALPDEALVGNRMAQRVVERSVPSSKDESDTAQGPSVGMRAAEPKVRKAQAIATDYEDHRPSQLVAIQVAEAYRWQHLASRTGPWEAC